MPWTHPAYWSQALTPLVMDGDRRPIVAFLEVGDGLVVVSSAYRQNGFPTARFLQNLVTWAKDPTRIAAVRQRREAAAAAAQHLPEVTVPTLDPPPVVDGIIGQDEWQDAAVLSDFVSMDGTRSHTQRTVCRLGQTPLGLFVAFQCYDSDVANVSRRITQRDGAVWTDDCVEVFLVPSGGSKEYLHFIVNVSEAQYDEREADPEWDSYWVARTGLSPDMWTAELFIPFASLGITAQNPPAASWTGNFYRERPGRGGAPMELTGWSPTFGNFAVVSHFGVLRGIQAPADRYTLAPEIAVSLPDRWYAGDNTVTATVTALPDRWTAFTLSCAEVGGRMETEVALRVQLGPGQSASIPVTVALDTDAPRAFQLLARDAAEPERVLAASRVIRALPAPVLELTLLSPTFRNMIQSRDPDKTLRLTGWIGDPGPVTGDLRLRASLIPEGRLRPIWQEAQAVTPRAGVRFESSLADVPPGKYELQIDLQDAAQRLIARDRRELRVAAPAPVEVTFDSRRACLVNGQPVFPIGLYHVSEPALELVNARARELGLPEMSLREMLAGCRDHGFNTVVRGWGMPSEEFMEVAQELGIWVLPEVGAPGSAALQGMVAFANRYSNILAWYGVDEPAGDRLQWALDAHARFAAADPHRPVTAACNNVGVFADALRAYDILMMDPYVIYPKRGPSLEAIAGWVRAGMRAGGGRVPIWVVPQAFGIDNAWDEPTPEEIRCQAYLSIVHGATGLIWYAWFTTEPWSGNPKGRNQWFLPDSPLWPCFKELNAEINALAPTILQGEPRGPATCDNEAIHSHLWEAGGVTTLIAVNPWRTKKTCRFSGLLGQVAEAIFEGRELPLQDGAFSDTFAPCATHVYRLR